MGLGVGQNSLTEKEYNCGNYSGVISILVCVKGVRIVFPLQLNHLALCQPIALYRLIDYFC